MLSLRLLLVAAWAGALVLAGVLAPAAVASGPPPGCLGPLALLVDRSGSMAAHDRLGELRLGVADALQAARPASQGDVVIPFAGEVRAPIGAAAGWGAAMGRAMAGEDEGSTELDGVLRSGVPLAGAGLIVITDGEAELTSAPRGLLALIVVDGEPGARTTAAVRAAGGRVLVVRTPVDAGGLIDGLCAPRPPAAAPDAVLLSGLGTTVRGVVGARSAAQCARADELRSWCTALAARGWRVSAVPAAPRAAGRAVIDSTGRLAENGAALRRWLSRIGPPRQARSRPILIGHSMGGLIAHEAIRRGAPVRALITVGTPHAGSYGADAYAAARLAVAGCLLLCAPTAAALRVATATSRARFGAALDDLTRARRTREAPLGSPGVPYAAWAGVPNAAVVLPRGLAWRSADHDYSAPNDGIVGRGSATGRLAGLAPQLVVDDGHARHSTSVPPRGLETEMGSPAVAGWLVRAAGHLAPLQSRAARARASGQSGRPRRAPLALRPRRVSVRLQPIAPLAPGAPGVELGPDAVVVATAPIAVLCDGTPLQLIDAGAGLWFLDLGTMGCARAARAPHMVTVPPDVPVLIGAALGRQAGEAELTVTRRGTGWRAIVRLSGVEGRPQLLRGERRLTLRRARDEEWGARRWVARLGKRGASRIQAQVLAVGRSDMVGELVLP